MDERTFIMIKPDAVKRGLVADIAKRFEQKGFKLVAMKFTKVHVTSLGTHVVTVYWVLNEKNNDFRGFIGFVAVYILQFTYCSYINI